jgi:hypothetical protein
MTRTTDTCDRATDGDISFEAAGETFTLQVFADPSGLRGQVFRGEEKIAGVQIYHSKDRELLLRQARTNKAVLRAASST